MLLHWLIVAACILVSTICFILVLIQMFQNGQGGLGLVCILLVLCVGIGGFVAFVVGWMNADNWRIRNIMVVWTVCVVIGMVVGGGFRFGLFG